MSAFILPTEGFAALASELNYYAANPSSPLHYSVLTYLGTCSVKEQCQALYEANVTAVNERYGETNPLQPIPWPESWASYPNWSHIQLVKHLRCLHYQMAEGNVADSEIHKQLDHFTGELCMVIVSKSPGYDKAAWGWE